MVKLANKLKKYIVISISFSCISFRADSKRTSANLPLRARYFDFQEIWGEKISDATVRTRDLWAMKSQAMINQSQDKDNLDD